MAENARIREEWLASGESVQIRSAHADAVHSHESLVFVGCLRRGELFLESSRLLKYDLSHESDGSNLPAGYLALANGRAATLAATVR
jgi:hypothetical protein